MAYSILYNFFLVYFPVLFLLYIWGYDRKVEEQLPAVNYYFIIYVYIISLIIISSTPATYFDGSDKGRYLYSFDTLQFSDISDFTKDKGWYIYMCIMRVLTFGNSTFFFIITTFIYGISFWVLARRYFVKEYVGYFLVMCLGCMGFVGYANNTIRNGIALAFCLYALSLEGKKILKLLLIILAISIHFSVALFILTYIYTLYVRKNSLALCIWMSCLIIAILNIDVSHFFTSITGLDNRVADYMLNQNFSDPTYAKAGSFRWDFLLYSIAPLYIARQWKVNWGYDKFYTSIINMYLLLNSIWLLVMRVPYADRFAFFSWFLIPMIVLYPVLKKYVFLTNITKKVCLFMSLFILTNFIFNFLD